ncbi:MAG: arginine--tRNA ligase [Planctomycetota bacterium]|nr:arginine--tRNA ligase [Planctomycetota bacterium]
MSLLAEIKSRFQPALSRFGEDVDQLLSLIKPSQDAKFGDYQLNCAMPLGKKLGQPPREIAERIIEEVDLDGFCEKVEVAGPGFINLTLDRSLLVREVRKALADEHLGVSRTSRPKTIVIDFSSPNVAKPMHVGHIRSTVIGDALAKILGFLGHHVITDNHLGDWGTQFGMIIYGYKNFANPDAYDENPVAELSRIYRYVRKLMDHFEKKAALPKKEKELQVLGEKAGELKSCEPANEKEAKKQAKSLKSLEKKMEETRSELAKLAQYFDAMSQDKPFQDDLEKHRDVSTSVLTETARLHEGDAENTRLWQQFMPHCRDEIQRVYSRLQIEFDYEYGESHYHSLLGKVVEDFKAKGFAEESEGAQCVFLDGFDAPMIIQKKDGAFLYSTTDLATIKFRMETWNPDTLLYVVDHRQGEHFQKLFAAARKWGYTGPEYFHVAFGTVMDQNRKPYKTRAGDTVGLEGLLDEAVENALGLVHEINDKRATSEQLSESECSEVARTVGIGGLKYFDLSQHRASDYVFTYEKMLALKGDTAPYVQMSYSRVRGIFRKGNYDPAAVDSSSVELVLDQPAEKALAIKLLRFEEALHEVTVEYKPNALTHYLFELAQQFAVFFESCPVLKAESEPLMQSRLLLCDLTARVIKQGLALLGIEVREKM